MAALDRDLVRPVQQQRASRRRTFRGRFVSQTEAMRPDAAHRVIACGVISRVFSSRTPGRVVVGG